MKKILAVFGVIIIIVILTLIGTALINQSRQQQSASTVQTTQPPASVPSRLGAIPRQFPNKPQIIRNDTKAIDPLLTEDSGICGRVVYVSASGHPEANASENQLSVYNDQNRLIETLFPNRDGSFYVIADPGSYRIVDTIYHTTTPPLSLVKGRCAVFTMRIPIP